MYLDNILITNTKIANERIVVSTPRGHNRNKNKHYGNNTYNRTDEHSNFMLPIIALLLLRCLMVHMYIINLNK